MGRVARAWGEAGVSAARVADGAAKRAAVTKRPADAAKKRRERGEFAIVQSAYTLIPIWDCSGRYRRR